MKNNNDNNNNNNDQKLRIIKLLKIYIFFNSVP